MRSFLLALLKKNPRLFDYSKRGSRLMGLTTPLYQSINNFQRDREEICFLQIGSNDGISNDPLREFLVSSKKWRGCFVEPIQEVFRELKRNYRYQDSHNLHFKNCAISKKSGVTTMYRIASRFHHEFQCQPDQLASFDSSHIINFFPDRNDLADKIEGVEIPTVGMRDLVEEMMRDFGRIDLLHMDVEGHELELLQEMPFDLCQPDLIIFEVAHMKNRQLAYDLLEANHYRITEHGPDALAWISQAELPGHSAV